MTQVYPDSGNLSGRWTLSQVTHNIRNSGWIPYDSLDDFNNAINPCLRRQKLCDPTIGPVILDGAGDSVLCLPTGVVEGVQTIIPHPSGDSVPSPLDTKIPRYARLFFELFPSGRPVEGRDRVDSILCGATSDEHRIATKDIDVFIPEVDIVCGSGTPTAYEFPTHKLPISPCFIYTDASGLDILEPTVQFTPSGWNLQNVSGLRVAYTPDNGVRVTGILNIANSSEIQFRWRRVYEDWTISEKQIFLTGTLDIHGKDNCAGQAISGHSESGLLFFQQALGGSVTTADMQYTAKTNCADGLTEYHYEGIVPYDHPIWSNVTVSGSFQSAVATKNGYWTLKMTHAYSSGLWFDPDGEPLFTEPAGSSTSWRTYSALNCNDVNSVPIAPPITYSDIHFDKELGSRGNENIYYTANENCSDISLDGTTTYLSNGFVQFKEPMSANVYKEKLDLTLYEYYPTGAWTVDDISCGPNSPPGSRFFASLSQDQLTANTHYYNSHIDPSVQLGTGGTWKSYDFCYKLAGRCSVDDVIEVGSCGICAGLEHKNYCVCPTGECKHTYYGWGGDEEISDTGTLQVYINWNSGRDLEHRYLIQGVRSADGAEGIAAIEGGGGGGSATVEWKSLWARVISSGNSYLYIGHPNADFLDEKSGYGDDFLDPLESFTSQYVADVTGIKTCISTYDRCSGYHSQLPAGESAYWDPTGSQGQWCGGKSDIMNTGNPSLSGNDSPEGTLRYFDIINLPTSGINCHWFAHTPVRPNTICASYCEDKFCADQITLHHPYEKKSDPKIIRGESTYSSGPQACRALRESLKSTSPAGSVLDIDWYSGPGEHPHSNDPYGPYKYRTSSCDAAISKAKEYDDANFVKRLTDISVVNPDERWENHPAHMHSTYNPTPKGVGQDEFIPIGDYAYINGKAWYQWYPHKLGLDARSYGGETEDDAISGMPPEDICDLLDEIHDTDYEKGCEELQNRTFSQLGIPSDIVWTTGVYDAVSCEGVSPWNCDTGDETRCPNITVPCASGETLSIPIDVGLNFGVSCREAEATFYGMSMVDDIEFVSLSTCGSCSYAGLNVLPIGSVNSYSTDLTESEWGVPIDIDRPCNEEEDSAGYPGKTSFTLYYAGQRWAGGAVPAISGVWYDTSGAGVDDRFIITVQPTSDALRRWTCKNLRFAAIKSGSGATAELDFRWPYNDLYWSYCAGTDIPLNLVPC